uniref:Secreted protein n=1 Tax=Macrostomum lignano TaxID=282301 RepID=A0A1I8FAT9_9PLAT
MFLLLLPRSIVMDPGRPPPLRFRRRAVIAFAASWRAHFVPPENVHRVLFFQPTAACSASAQRLVLVIPRHISTSGWAWRTASSPGQRVVFRDPGRSLMSKAACSSIRIGVHNTFRACYCVSRGGDARPSCWCNIIHHPDHPDAAHYHGSPAPGTPHPTSWQERNLELANLTLATSTRPSLLSQQRDRPQGAAEAPQRSCCRTGPPPQTDLGRAAQSASMCSESARIVTWPSGRFSLRQRVPPVHSRLLHPSRQHLLFPLWCSTGCHDPAGAAVAPCDGTSSQGGG